MRYRLLLLAAAVLLPACRAVAPTAPGISYRCADGRTVQARYVGSDRAELVVDGALHRLAIARSASGARYTGDGWQWWTKGLRDAWLAPLQPGQSIASTPGAACRAGD